MEAEDRIGEVEDRMVEINESERKKEKLIKRNEDNLRDLQDWSRLRECGSRVWCLTAASAQLSPSLRT